MKKALSVLLALLFVLSAFPMTALQTHAASESDLTFELNEDGETFSVTGCYESATGDLVIPSVHDGKPVTTLLSSRYPQYGMDPLTGEEIILNYLSKGTFAGCNQLTSITIPDSVTNIEGGAFADCTGLKSVTLPAGLKEIKSLSNSVYTGYSETSSRYEYVGLFEGCTSLKSITIPDGVISIGRDAFRGCTAMTSITLPDSVQTIEGGAFYECTRLNSVKLSDNLISIGSYTVFDEPYIWQCGAFEGCTGLDSLVVPNSVTSIGYRAFYGCSGLTTILIPDSVTSIGGGAFYGCTALKNIVLPSGISSLNDTYFQDYDTIERYFGFFGNCTSLQSISIPGSVTSIGDNAFNGCIGLQAINVDPANTVYSSVSGILLDALQTKIITVPSSFSGTVRIPDGVTTVGTLFAGRSSLTGITLPGSVGSLQENAFAGCTGLKTLTLREGITTIGATAFSGCTALTDVSLPDGLKVINAQAFLNCTALRDLTVPASVTSLSNNAFVGCTNLTLHGLPGSYVETYALENNIPFEPLDSHTYHTFGEWQTTKAATCTATGTQTRTCSDCGATETKTIAKIAHTYGAAWKHDGTNHWHACTVCGAVKDKAAHTFGAWQTTKAATYTAEGEETRTCTVCGAIEKRSLAKLTLPAPATIKVAKVAKGMKVTWSAASGATKYRVYRRELDSSGKVIAGWKALLTTANAATRTYTDTKAVNGHRYQYTVRTYRSDANGSAWSPVGTCTAYYCLATPAVTLANATSGVKLTWKAVKAATGYIVYRKAGSATTWTKVATLKGNGKTSYVDTKRSNGVTYTYTVKAYHGNNYSAYTAKKILFLTAPTKATVSSGKTGITVKWGKNAKASGYYVYRKAGSGAWTKIATVQGAAKVTYLDKSAKKGTTYAYRAVAYKGTTRSGYYTSASIKDKY